MRPRSRAQKRWWRTMLVTAAVLVLGVKPLDAATSPATTCVGEPWTRDSDMLYCSEASGLICVARRAGTNAATFVTTTTAAAAEMITSGSAG